MAQPKIKFDSTTHQFGTIKEEDGKVTGKFKFVNQGDSTLYIVSVRPGCGCTAANYTKTGIAPGDSGFVEATYNPAGRPGNFHKSIRVKTNVPEHRASTSNGMYIFIKGTVLKRPPTVFELAGYKTGQGMIRVKENRVEVYAKNSETKTIVLTVRNFWNKPATFNFTKLPASVTESKRSFKNELAPDQEGTIELTFDATKYEKFGNSRITIPIETNDSIAKRKYVYVTLNIEEDFSKYTQEQLKNAPVLDLSTDVLEFDTLPIGKTLVKTVTITNKGKSPLIVRQIKPSNSYFKVKPLAKSTLQKGESTELSVTFTPRGRKGIPLNAGIAIICNDPKSANKEIRASGFTKK